MFKQPNISVSFYWGGERWSSLSSLYETLRLVNCGWAQEWFQRKQNEGVLHQSNSDFLRYKSYQCQAAEAGKDSADLSIFLNQLPHLFETFGFTSGKCVRGFNFQASRCSFLTNIRWELSRRITLNMHSSMTTEHLLMKTVLCGQKWFKCNESALKTVLRIWCLDKLNSNWLSLAESLVLTVC